MFLLRAASIVSGVISTTVSTEIRPDEPTANANAAAVASSGSSAVT